MSTELMNVHRAHCRRRHGLILVPLWAAIGCAQVDQTDPQSVGSYILGQISLGEGLTAPSPAWVYATRVPEGITFLDLACTPYSEYAAFSDPRPVWRAIVRLEDSISLPTSYGYGGLAGEPRIRGFAVVSPDNEALRARSGEPPIIPGTLYGASEVVELVPCFRPQDAGTRCYVGGSNMLPVVLDHVFEGCP